ESMSPGSIMPDYPWLFDKDLDTKYTSAKIKVLQSMGVPYPEGFAEVAEENLKTQALTVVESLKNDGIEQENLEAKRIVALIAYLQRLGTDHKPEATIESED
ncbi:MAG: cbb3-type cytochrome c oxidase subunit II, partial [Saprospiraceae bacterium]|nr:cbb3-type cytochrome c oxidase subunit II [Saprospiraceae bacterium]